METKKIKVYIKTDDQDRITTIGSGIFITDTSNWIEIDEGIGDKYAHAQNEYLTKGLNNLETGCCNYKWQDNQVIERTEEEKRADIAAWQDPPLPSTLDRQMADLQIALIEQVEVNMALQDEITDLQMSIVELYESLEV